MPIFPTNCFAGSPFSRFLSDLDFTLIDVGMRGGAEPDMLPIAFATHVIGFEPEPDAFNELIAAGAGPWKSQQIFPEAIAREETTMQLYVTDDPQSSSLLEPDGQIGRVYDKRQFFDIDHTVQVKTTDLDAALEGRIPAKPCFLKLDVEGLEAEILDGAKNTLDDVAIIKIEISMLPLNKGQPVFGDIDRALATRGFRLFDLLTLHRWRREGYVIHPHLTRGPYPYARGALMHGDALYVRDVFPGGAEAENHALTLRTVPALLAYGYFDHALTILEQDSIRERVQEEFGLEPDAAIKFVARKFGNTAWTRAFRQQLRGVGTFIKSGIRGYRPW